MKLGISTFSFPRSLASGAMNATQLVQWAVDEGAGAVQFGDNHSLVDAPDQEDAIALAEGAGIALEIGTRGIDPDRLARHFELAERVGSPFVRLVIDQHDDEPTPEEAVERLRPFALRNGVVLAIENHDRFPARVLASMVQALGCRVCLDTANSLGSLEGTETVVSVLGPLTINLHVKDVRATRKPANLGFDILGVAAGAGQVNWGWVISQVPDAVSATVELWTPDVPNAAELEDAWVRQSLTHLRGLV